MNRLAGASSPYLRQHADNPVEWYPWGDEALERARAEDKPLFVSIGYAACHWCHVMAHESFEDRETADDLARSFISVKVDREERPDVDAVYMAAVQAMTGAGGWPMSVFCTPDGRPFFAGTYFPPADRHGMPSFRRLVASVAAAWRDRRSDVEAQADALAGAVAADASMVDRLAAAPGTAGAPDGSSVPGAAGAAVRPEWPAVLDAVVATLGQRFDATWGGFGPAPKFPRPTLVELCLRHHGRTNAAAAMAMATRTLDAMAAGGIYDHVQGGFARYATDRCWLVPHFEKMLTDQALLARAYLHAWQATGAHAYLQVATETIDATLETMAAPGGGLCASLDADADGIEGGHAVWTPAQVHAALDAAGQADAAGDVCAWYGITEEGNWEGRSIPHRPIGATLKRPPEIEAARRVLLASRSRRPQPGRDEKIITEWNAMFVATLAEAAAARGTGRWADTAVGLAEALMARNRRADGRWLRVPAGTDGTAIPAFAADYAWLVESCIRLAELTGSLRWMDQAQEMAADLLDLFWDDATGGLFSSGRDAERLIVRGKDVVDGAVPSANSAAAVALLRLGALTGDDRWRAAGARIVELLGPLLATQPMAVSDMVPALALATEGVEVVVTGDRPDLLETVRRYWLPDAVVAWGERGSSPLWEGRPDGAGYVCRRFVCQEPAKDPATLDRQVVPLSVGVAR